MPDSPAHDAGIRAGEVLLRINGEDIRDVVDYQYLSVLPDIDVTLAGRALHIEKEAGAPLGLVFEEALMDRQRTCANACIFCFIDQMPPGLRQTLYAKDDDWRLSLMMGNYVTLTNVGEREFARIIARRVSPLYISVHATDDAVRCRMMRNKRAGGILERLRVLAEAGIKFHLQVVLCPGWNDGAVLARTMTQLAGLYPAAQSMAVVPVGMTKFRAQLVDITPVNRAKARALLDQVEDFQRRALVKLGTRFVFPSDEWYVLAGRDVPAYEAYETFPQIDNGVGMMALLRDEFTCALDDLPREHAPRRVTVVTGKSAAGFLEALIAPLAGVQAQIVPVVNRFFGERITVAGLVTGGDIARALAGRDLGQEVLLPATMLRAQGDRFLDDMTLAELQQALGAPVRAVPVEGEALACALAGINGEEC